MNDPSSIKERTAYFLHKLEGTLQATEARKVAVEAKRTELLIQQDMLERSRVAIEQARPLLSASSIKQLEQLANSALEAIFNIQGEIRYDIESKRFMLIQDDIEHDLADASGGGLVTVISFTFDLFLLVKNGCRRLLVYDEAFTAVSDAYYENFIRFMRTACKDLNVDLCLVSHDARLTTDMVDHVYAVENGKTIKVK